MTTVDASAFTVPEHGHWVQTYSGIPFDLQNYQVNQINIDDIAHALSHSSRWNGHAREMLTIAQHSVLVSQRIEEITGHPMHALAGLLHDASEAYLGDVVTPLKRRLPEYKEEERKLMRVIEDAFGLDTGELESEAVKEADAELLATEAYDLFDHLLWTPEKLPLPGGLPPVQTPAQAKQAFLDRYWELEAWAVNAGYM